VLFLSCFKSKGEDVSDNTFPNLLHLAYLCIIGKAYAYYMPDFKAYFFLKTSERHDPGAGKRHLCASGQTLALTDATALENHGGGLTLTFCPIAFTKDCDPDEQRGFCQDTSGPARINNQVPNTVRGKQPRSLTMLHELVHVTLGPEDSPDKIGNDDICKCHCTALVPN
jgi:hypothetical protein